MGLFSIGGGYAAMPLIQSQVVEKQGWLTMSEFADLITIAEMTPGPIAINSATFVGIRIAGVAGAVTATLGCITPSLIITSILAVIYYRYKKLSAFQSILGSIRPAVVALIASAGVLIFLQVVFGGKDFDITNLSLPGILIFAAAVFILRKFKLNPICVMCLCGVAGLLAGMLGGGL